jgi:hypothetical protein
LLARCVQRAQLAAEQTLAVEMSAHALDELSLWQRCDLAWRQPGAQHRADGLTLHPGAAGSSQFREHPFERVANQNLLLGASVRQSHVLMKGASERGVGRREALGLGKVPDSQHLGELHRIALVVFGAREVCALAVTLGCERIDQPPGQRVLVQEVDQRLPVMIGRLHGDHHRCSAADRAESAGSLDKLLEPTQRVSHPKAC